MRVSPPGVVHINSPVTGQNHRFLARVFRWRENKKYFKKLEQNKNIDSNKLFLHAYKLKIIKKDGIKEEFTAPLPDHIRKFCYLYKIPINETFINKFVISNILEGAKELKN